MKEVKVVPVAEDLLVDFGEVERLTLCKFLAHDERCVYCQPHRGGRMCVFNFQFFGR